MSSMRIAYPPPPFLAHSQESKAVRAFPRCSSPVGLGSGLAGLRLRGHSLAERSAEIATPALHRIGDEWAQGKLSVADEHVAAQAVIDAVARSQPLAEPPGEPVRADRGTAVVAAVAGELHGIASTMAGFLLRAQGFEVP